MNHPSVANLHTFTQRAIQGEARLAHAHEGAVSVDAVLWHAVTCVGPIQTFIDIYMCKSVS